MKQAPLESHLFIVLSLLTEQEKTLKSHLQVGNHGPDRKGSWPSSWPHGRSHPRSPPSLWGPAIEHSHWGPSAVHWGCPHYKEIFACVLKVKKNLKIWFKPTPLQHHRMSISVSSSIKWAWYSLPDPPLRNVTGLRRDQCELTPQSSWGEWLWSSHFWSTVRGTSFPPYLWPLRISSLETQWLKGRLEAWEGSFYVST